MKRAWSCAPGNPEWVFYEGPPTANGKPGAHHVLARIFKDIYPRYRTMRGYHVGRKGGWDCHGLPVELEIEKRLGFDHKEQIEAYGVAEFNRLCRESVTAYIDEWNRMTERIGFWLDLDDAYLTMNDAYIESVWWVLSEFGKKGLLYEGYKVVPYCPRCGTALSSHEVATGYKMVTDPSVFVRFPLMEPERGAAVTAPRGGATASGEPAPAPSRPSPPTACRCRCWSGPPRPGRSSPTWPRPWAPTSRTPGPGWAASTSSWPPTWSRPCSARRPSSRRPSRARPWSAGTTGRPITSSRPTSPPGGSSPPTTSPPTRAPASSTSPRPSAPTTWSSARPTTCRSSCPSTRRASSPPRSPPGPACSSRTPTPASWTTSRTAACCFARQPYEHNYPFCWRCDTPLIYYAKSSWYVRTTARKDALLGANEEVTWYPEHIKHGRFGKWLENNIDWSLSRDRYWGTPAARLALRRGPRHGGRLPGGAGRAGRR